MTDIKKSFFNKGINSDIDKIEEEMSIYNVMPQDMLIG